MRGRSSKFCKECSILSEVFNAKQTEESDRAHIEQVTYHSILLFRFLLQEIAVSFLKKLDNDYQTFKRVLALQSRALVISSQ